MYYLYVKTHNITGLKYLGQTKQSDPNIYKGSGKYWKNHINIHGYDVTTEILFQTNSKIELIEKGIYYSKLWNIVESKEWANLTEENGYGGNGSHWKGKRRSIESRLKMSETRIKNKTFSGIKNPMHGKKHLEETKRLQSLRMKGKNIGSKNGMYGKPRNDLIERNKKGKGKHWYTNGIQSKQCFPNEVPVGWLKGRSFQNCTSSKNV